MKKIIAGLFLFAFTTAEAQQNNETEKKQVMEKINLFFKVLETKDTALYKSLVMPNGQIWTVTRQQDTLKNTLRTFADDMKSLAVMNKVIEERPLRADINIHQDIAIAWVPYTLSLDGQFSHCGIDVFTLLRTKDGWKIVNASYSKEPDGCAELKQN